MGPELSLDEGELVFGAFTLAGVCPQLQCSGSLLGPDHALQALRLGMQSE